MTAIAVISLLSFGLPIAALVLAFVRRKRQEVIGRALPRRTEESDAEKIARALRAPRRGGRS